MRKKKEQFGWCKSWKSLFIVTNLFSITFALIHLFSKMAYVSDQTSHGKLAILIAVCHVYPIFVLRLYYENFNMLIKEGKATKSSKMFWIGVASIIAWEIVNILVLIFV